MASLSDKQALFCEEYAADPNATAAAIKAGYSQSTARAQGSRLLTNVDVRKRVEELRAEQSERTRIDADMVVNHLAGELFADMAELFSADNTLKPVWEWPPIWRTGLVCGFDQTEAADGTRVTKIRLSDRTRRAEMLARHLGLFEPESRPKDSEPRRLYVEVVHADSDEIAP